MGRRPAGLRGLRDQSPSPSHRPLRRPRVLRLHPVGAAMASDAIGDVGDAFPPMPRGDGVGLVRVAAETSVAACVVTHMTGRAGRAVGAGQGEKAVVRERRGLPRAGLVTGAAVRRGSRVERVLRRGVAGRATGLGDGRQHGVHKSGRRGAGYAGDAVIVMAGHAVPVRQFLMEGAPGEGRSDGGARDGPHAYGRDAVARDASLDRGAAERGVASKAVSRQSGMRRDQRAGRDHLVRIAEGQDRDDPQADRDDSQDPGTLPFHLQKRRMATM